MATKGDNPAQAAAAGAAKEALVREILERVGDKRTLLVIEEPGSGGELRFTRLRDRIGGVSQKMLTKTRLELERDGLVARRVHPVVPPRVDNRLTPLGEALGEAVCGVWAWVEEHLDEVARCRRAYDRRTQARRGGQTLTARKTSPGQKFVAGCRSWQPWPAIAIRSRRK